MGEFVLWSDYARLKAEVYRLEEIVGSDAIDRKYGMCCDASDEVKRLKAEVERLEQKHQQMIEFICQCVAKGNFKAFKNGSVKFGNAAKEGKQP